tara:strand:+ start:92 stop:388 length:297 start_codon:yes stop_codon:yes gene_type:complete
MEENDDSMQFLEDLNEYNESMNNAYLIITKRKTLDDIYLEVDSGTYKNFYLPFDPINDNGTDEGTLELLIDHFSISEEYEKCSELQKLKTQCSDKQTE